MRPTEGTGKPEGFIFFGKNLFHMKKLTYCLFLAALPFLTLAQVAGPCPSSSAPPADICTQGCVFCDFNGYTGSTVGYTPSFIPGFCGTIENDQWIGFVAGNTSGTFTATPSNCANGDGIQIALYEGCMGSPLFCAMGGTGYGTTPVFLNADGLVPGRTYFLQVDGYAGDQCDFNLTVAPPSVANPPGPPAPALPPSGAVMACPGAVEQYTIPDVANAGFYTWTAPPGALIYGVASPLTFPAPDGKSIYITWGISGGQVCVTPGNACNPGQTTCINVSVVPIPPTILPPVTICAENAPYQLPWGGSVSSSGTYQTTFDNGTGCDSIVRQTVTVKAPIVTNLGIKALCTDECLTVCDSSFCSAGSYSMVCPSAQGCDSTVQFTILVLDYTFLQAPYGKSITCAIPEVELTGFPNDNASWQNNQGQTISNTTQLVVTTPGFYTFTATQSLGTVFCEVEETVLVKLNTQAPEITASGGVLDATHPTVQLMGHSINQPVQYSWTGPGGFVSNLQNPTVNVPGPYTLTVVNTGNGCSSSITVNVTQQ